VHLRPISVISPVMVEQMGIEPTTSGLRDRRSPN
jgi:hypothetical protein